jgi:type I restriction enzyme R subunit
MKGRGVRVMDSHDFNAVTPDATAKTRFIIVDAVGLCESNLTDTRPLDRQPTVPLQKLIQSVAFGSTDPDVLSTLAGRLARLDRQIGDDDRKKLTAIAEGRSLGEIAAGIVAALDPDRQRDLARRNAGLPPETEPDPEQIDAAAQELLRAAAAPLASNPALRNEIVLTKQRAEQTIDTISSDIVLEAAFSDDAKERARTLVTSFEAFIRDSKDEITALQVLYSRPYRERLRFADIKALAQALGAPPRNWIPDRLWRAYEVLDRSKVHSSGERMLTDIVSLVRFALHQEDELVPFAESVNARFEGWLAMQEVTGHEFTADQRKWLELIRDHVGAGFAIGLDDFDVAPFLQEGGLGRAHALFGEALPRLLDELNEALVA